jgi:hypothetical protein
MRISHIKTVPSPLPYINSFEDESAYLVLLIYVFQVENWCPHLPWRAKNPYEEADHNSLVNDFEKSLPRLVYSGQMTSDTCGVLRC